MTSHWFDETADAILADVSKAEAVAGTKSKEFEATVTDLRRYTLTETVYRAQDAARVLPVLLSAGTVTRSPERGRLSGEVLITLA